GRPMIVHNRGWGPQLEDALFADQITGHYRYTGVLPPAGGPRSRKLGEPTLVRRPLCAGGRPEVSIGPNVICPASAAATGRSAALPGPRAR
ncbi:MAG TPA: DUF1287 domain-containing protein, partial [Hyphomicrobiaceae bacterium]|nr:DUF1287 domain-containing protein [Hyphomicrobiaceae bacterium]